MAAWKNTSAKRGKRKRRILLLLAVSALFFVCLMVDCFRKGMFDGVRDNFSAPKRAERAVIKEKPKKKWDHQKIRVLLTNGTMTDIYHEEVILSGTKTLQREEKKKKRTVEYKAGKQVRLTRSDVKAAGGRIVFRSDGGRCRVHSIRRREKVPVYRGSLTVKWTGQGLLLINTLTLSDYLCGVVPGEMSPEYPMQALMAQAVCARSFAWNQMKSDRYQKYGADVDDTTSFQVYNMAGEDARTTKAVKRTAGQMLYDGNEVITAYYYSTSWGCSATAKEVWGGKDGGRYPRILQVTKNSRKKREVASELDLSEEGLFQEFMTKRLCETYDEESSWYRWSITLPAGELGRRYGIGKVLSIQIRKREKSGLLTEVRLVGKKGRRTISGQQEIREGLMLPGRQLTRQDGSKSSFSMLPSAAFFVRQSVENGRACFLLTGGGFGHGTGMSQCGASAMAKEGADYREILRHYYSGCKIRRPSQ